MSRSRIGAFIDEFPFIEKEFEGIYETNIAEIKVARVDSELLLRERKDYWGSDPGGPMQIAEDDIVFFDKEGNNLGKAGYRLLYPNPNFNFFKFWGKREPRWLRNPPEPTSQGELVETSSHESIGNALKRLGIENKVYFILLIVPFDFNEMSAGKFYITIYKPPKNISFSEWLKNEPQRERESLKRELESID